MNLVQVHTIEDARQFLRERAGQTLRAEDLHMLAKQFQAQRRQLMALADDLGIKVNGGSEAR